MGIDQPMFGRRRREALLELVARSLAADAEARTALLEAILQVDARLAAGLHEQQRARATTDATVQHLRAATVATRDDMARALGHLTHICALLAERLDDDQAERNLLLARLRERELGRPRQLEASRSA